MKKLPLELKIGWIMVAIAVAAVLFLVCVGIDKPSLTEPRLAIVPDGAYVFAAYFKIDIQDWAEDCEKSAARFCKDHNNCYDIVIGFGKDSDRSFTCSEFYNLITNNGTVVPVPN